MDIFKRTARELLRELKTIQKLDLVSTPYQKILQIINHKLFVPITIAKIHAGQYVERVRIHPADEVFTKKSDLSYILDPKVIKGFGRANPPGKAMFYGAIKSSSVASPRIVAVAETESALQGISKGVTNKKFVMTVGKWLVRQDLIVSEMVFKKEAIEKMPEVKRAFELQSQLIMEKQSFPEAKQIIILLEFFSEIMAKRSITNSDYKLGAAFTESVLKRGNLDGIMFQSVQTDFEGTNVALTPRAVDNYLALEEALIIEVEIRGRRVFLNKMATTGMLQPDQLEFSWVSLKKTPPEAIERFFETGELPQDDR